MKTTKFRIGVNPAEKPITVDAEKLLEQRMLVCTNSGGGKSYFLRVLAEHTTQIVPTIILDPEAEYSTLREKRDMVLVGPGGEADTAIETAAELATVLAEMRVSAVIDLYALPKAQRRTFVRVFLTRLLSLPKRLWGPMFVIVDEAHDFAPESGKVESTDSVISLMCQGRKRGICGIPASQRLAKIHKDVTSETNNLILGRFAQDLDLRRASDLLGFSGKEKWPTMRGLQPGIMHATGGALSIEGVSMLFVDKALTTHVKPGQRYTMEPPKPSRAILKVAPELASLKKKADEELSEIDRLRRENAALRQAKPARAAAPAPAPAIVAPSAQQLKAAFDRGADQARKLILAEISKSQVDVMHGLQQASNGLASISKRVQKVAPAFDAKLMPAAKAGAVVVPRGAARAVSPKTAPARTVSAPGTAKITGGTRKLMMALAQYPDGLDRKALSHISGLRQSGTFRTYLSHMRTSGWITDEGDKLVITDEGCSALGPVDALPTGEDLQRYWLGKMGGGQQRILQALIDAGEDGIAREDLPAAADMTENGSLRTYISKLRGLQLIHGDKHLHVAETLLG